MESSISTTTQNDSVTLRAWTQGDQGAQRSVSKLIERINKQEGSFRDLTEESVAETNRQADLDIHTNENSEAEDPAQDEKSRRDAVVKAKGEIIQLATQAWTESSHTLDLISLVVSQFNPKTAEYTMTPFIKQTLPVGCLGAEFLEAPIQSGSTTLSSDLTSFGWKLESLAASADSLLHSATSLEAEMRKEAKYWDDILAVKQKGWSICTLPRDRHTLGVRYGFLESGPEFRDRGLAALRRGEDGAVDLDLGIAHLKPLRVQIKSHGEVLASTADPPLVAESLEESILQARNNIFDEELYHEMSREARTLTNRGVKCIGDGIVVPIEEDVDMVISLFDEEDPSTDVVPFLKPNNFHDIPELAMTCLRLLLSHSHRLHYKQRTELPSPLKKRKQQRSLLAITQPILSHIEHRSYLSQLQKHLGIVNKTLAEAGISLRISAAESNLHLDRLLQLPKSDVDDFADALVQHLCATLDSSVQIQFEDDGAELQISIRTHGSGTEFRTRKSSNDANTALGRTPDEMEFSDLQSVEDYIAHVIVLYLADFAAKRHNRWHITDPDEGELTTEPNMDGEVELLQIRLQAQELELTWRSSHINDTPEGIVQWSDSHDSSDKSFTEELARLSSLRDLVPTIM